MENELYDITLLGDNIQERLIKNYEIEATRAKYGYVSDECFWTRQALADIVMEALPLSIHFGDKMHDALYNIYLKLSVGK